jgi:hypothetical protein
VTAVVEFMIGAIQAVARHCATPPAHNQACCRLPTA